MSMSIIILRAATLPRSSSTQTPRSSPHTSFLLTKNGGCGSVGAFGLDAKKTPLLVVAERRMRFPERSHHLTCNNKDS